MARYRMAQWCDASAVSPIQVGPAEGAMWSVRCIRLDTAGNRGFSGASTMPGADVWRNSETSRGLDPDGWLVRRMGVDATGM